MGRGDRFQQSAQGADVDRLGDVMIEARLGRAALVLFLAPTGQRDQSDVVASRLPADLAGRP